MWHRAFVEAKPKGGFIELRVCLTCIFLHVSLDRMGLRVEELDIVSSPGEREDQ